MKIAFRIFVLSLLVLSETMAMNDGSVIVLNTSGTVQASPQGQADLLPINRGTVLPKGYTLRTGKFSEAVLLFSNGTVATVGETSNLRVSNFQQSPFNAGQEKLSDLSKEPSQSILALDLEIGDLIVQTKKLNKGSSFSISTAAGTAGIRGTQFQLNLSAAGKLSLDVAESAVAFSPAGGGPAVSISQGNGLDSSAGGTITQRPISIAASQAISVKNNAASTLSANVPLATVGEANKKAAAVSNQSEESNEQPANDSSEEEESSEESESSSDEGSSDTPIDETPPQAETNINVKFKVRTAEMIADYIATGNSLQQIRKLASQFGLSAQEINDSGLAYEDIIDATLDSGGNYEDIINAAVDSGEDIVDIFEALAEDERSNEDLLQTAEDLMESGVISKDEYKNIKILLGSGDPSNDDDNPPNSYSLILSAGSDGQNGNIDDQLVLRTVSADGVPINSVLDGLSVSQIESLFTPILQDSNPYTADIIALHALSKLEPSDLLNLGEDKVNNALKSAISITSILLTNIHLDNGVSLSDADISAIYSGQSYSGSTVLSAKDLTHAYENNIYLYELAQSLADYGAFSNKEAVEFIDDILEFAGGADNLTVPDTLYLNTKKSGASPSLFALTKHNQFFGIGKDENSISDESDQLFRIHPDNISAVVGSEIKIGSLDGITTEIDTSRWLEKAQSRDQKKIFAIAATDDVIIQGDLLIKNSNPSEDHALVIGAADHIEIYGDGSDQDGKTDIFFEGSNLALGSHGTMILKNVEIDTGGNLAIGSLDDLHLSSSSLNVGRFSDRDNVYLYADQMLRAERLDFHGRTREIHMEARTLDLKDVHFPQDSEVLLRSKDGYPNFYGGIYSGNSRKPYAVNFYSDSNKYGDSRITEGEFLQRTDGNFESTQLRTGSGEPAIEIQAFPR
jgi:hypothetical protein